MSDLYLEREDGSKVSPIDMTMKLAVYLNESISLHSVDGGSKLVVREEYKDLFPGILEFAGQAGYKEASPPPETVEE